MSQRLKVGVIGAGAVAQRRHLLEYAARNDVELLAVVDPNTTRAQQVADHFNIPHVLDDYRKALPLGLDAVSICSPNAFHCEQAMAFLKRKAHVLCEKPMTVSLKDARAMMNAAKRANRQLMVAHNQRNVASHVEGKRFYQSGILGRCITFRATFAHGGPESWSVDGVDGFFFKKDQAVFGAMADLGVHKIDLVRWFLEDNFVQATAVVDRLAKPDFCQVDDTAFAILRTAKGALGQLWAGWTYVGGADNSTIFYCEKGYIRLEDDPQFTVICHHADGREILMRTRPIQTNAPGGQYNSGVIDGFIDAIKTGTQVPIPASDAVHSLAAVIACVESSQTGKTITVGST